MTDAALNHRREMYAWAMVRATDAENPPLEAAFARVRREDFMPPGPWTLMRVPGGAETLAHNDPMLLYPQEAVPELLVVLDAASGINNGSPALHARMLHHLSVRGGDRVLHLGAGTGYYTAILAELVGPGGTVTAVEFMPHLAALAQANLAPWPWVEVLHGDAADFPTAPVDRIYVNFAVADPVDAWFDQLSEAGTLMFPLGLAFQRGALLRIARQGGGYAVRHISPCGFVGAGGRLAGGAAHQARLAAALAAGGIADVASLHRPPSQPAQAWLSTPRWTLSPEPLSPQPLSPEPLSPGPLGA